MQGLDAFVEKMMADWNVPALGLAVVEDGEVIVARGYGRRDIERGLQATAETIFAVGSNTKAFTTLAMGLLVDEGKLDWDRPVREYLPSFRLHDPFATERITPRDLVSHRSGLPRHDLVWYNSQASRKELVDRLRHLEPSKDLRAAWQYQNLMYMTAGYLVGELAGCGWEEFVQRRIFEPLGMRASNFSVDVSQQAPDFALPYDEKDDRITLLPFRNISTVGPAGSINSNIDDMAKWLLLHLNKGKAGGRQLISEGNLNQMHTPQMVIQEPIRFEEQLLFGYGLGWFIEVYRGRQLLHHGGNIDGFSALASFMPRDNIGVVALTNREGTPLPRIVSYYIYDHLLKLDELPWSDRAHTVFAEAKQAEKQAKEQSDADRKPGTRPSHPLSDYAGEYEHPGYGRLAVALSDDTLLAVINGLQMSVDHYHYDIFELRYEHFDMPYKASFATDVKGNIASVAVPFEPSLDAIVFTRAPDKTMSSREFLERFVGAYELTGLPLIIALRGDDVLVVSLPSQPDYELAPYQGTTFNLKNMAGFSIEFKVDERGDVAEALVSQPNGVFTARRVA